jgi:predicted outer membrane repeat protein
VKFNGLFTDGRERKEPMRIKTSLKLLIALLVLFSLVTGPAGARASSTFASDAPAACTVYVDPDAPSAPHDGTSWAHAYLDFQTALTAPATVAGCEMWVAGGTYKPTAGVDRTATFNLKDGVAIYGGFLGGESSLSQRNWELNHTILSGDIGSPGVASDNSLHVVKGTDISSTAILDGFTIRDGYANGSLPDNNGAGMYTDHGCPTMNHVTFQDNVAGAGGGGMYNLACYSTFTNVNFSDNTANIGGGMYNHNSSRPSVMGVTFDNNTATQYGGGLYEIYSWSHLSDVIFTSNHAGYGGGMATDISDRPVLEDVTFQGNTAVHAGGGMYEISGFSTLTDVTFTGNQADFGGGMTIDTNTGGTSSLTNVTFIGNTGTTASSRGGGVYVYASSPTLTNVVFSGNTANTGGGMGNYASHPILTNVTFSGNTASSGGGIYNFGNGSSSSNSTLRNSLLWGDTGGEVYNDTVSSTSTSTISYSLVQSCKPGGTWNPACGTDSGHNLADADPLFLDAAHGGLLLTNTSPAIDAGNDALVTVGETDVAGDPRISGAHVDLGAYEFSVRFVDSRATTGLNNGTSWANAFTSLQSALAAGTHNWEIWVAKGTYKPSSTGDRSASFELKPGAMIYGGFAGTETTRSQRDWKANPTSLSGDLNGDDGSNFTNYADNSYHVVQADQLDSLAILDGFTITGGYADGYAALGIGGGIDVEYCNPLLKNLVIQYNFGALGGGVHIESSSPSLYNVSFNENQALYYGGGLDIDTGNPVLTNVIFSGNYAGFDGGGIFAGAASPTLTNVSFWDNTGDNGGGLSVYLGSPTLTNVTFASNTATQGGGMYNAHDSHPVIRNSIAWGNTGGDLMNDAAAPSSTPTITYSLVQGCRPGGVWNSSCGTDGGHNLADANPIFLSPYYGDLHLTLHSPAIDQGNNDFVSGISTDLGGNPRIIGDAVDLGAYEYEDHSPLVSNFSKSGFAGHDITFTPFDFQTHFSDPDSDGLALIRITALPNHGVLYLNSTPVTLNQEIETVSILGMRFAPTSGWTGTTTFGWNGSDGRVYAKQGATVTLTILPPHFDVFLPAVVR